MAKEVRRFMVAW